MSGTIGVAGHRALSLGTLVIAGAALALYQMTSLVLGPVGSRQLHLSLAVPAVDTQERTESWTSSGKLALGTLVATAPATRLWARPAVAHRVASTPAASVAAAPAAPVASPVPVASPRPEPRPSQPPAPIVRGGPSPQPGGHKPDDRD
ncbi:MAG TPA: hypothetical protein VHK65_05365 [Candidatus Dormibacteraeota bacterium]|nr:hypothetical protein [Candidatus Dormibacteraeota bacterium]